MFSAIIGLASLALSAPIPGVPPDALDVPLFSLEQKLPDFLVRNNTTVELAVYDETPLMNVAFEKTDWPNVYFKAPEGTWDWSGVPGRGMFHTGLAPTASPEARARRYVDYARSAAGSRACADAAVAIRSAGILRWAGGAARNAPP